MRRLKLGEPRGEGVYNPHHGALEDARRGRVARAARARIRRMEPVILRTPRWSCPQAFLEEVALELAVAEPAVGCRTASLRPLQGRRPTDAWQFILRLVGQLGQGPEGPRPVPLVAERKGFRHALRDLLEVAEQQAPWPVALLAHGAEHLPLEVAEDLFDVWTDFCGARPAGRRFVLLVAGPPGAAALDLCDGQYIDLEDYGDVEASEVLGRIAGVPRGDLAAAARFTGGVPALLEALGGQARARRLGTRPEEILLHMGGMADEVRGVVDIVAAHDRLARRLDRLIPGEPLALVPELDDPLVAAGLVRRTRGPEGPSVILRAPAIAALLG